MSTIAATLITLNEADNLTELLPRLDWVDQIVVIDGGSTDATRQIAREHGCWVVKREFDTFARQRNHALPYVVCDWVLSIDADERPTAALASEIRRRTARSSVAAYRVPIRSTIFGRPLRRSGTQNDLPMRLFRRDLAQWTGDVHEVLDIRGKVGRLDGWLEHTTTADLHMFLTKMHRYTTLEARARVAAGRPPRRRDRWIGPGREIFRRLVWKQGFLDGPEGWAFCFLSGLCEWVQADRHRRFWAMRERADQPVECISHAATTHSEPEGRVEHVGNLSMEELPSQVEAV